MNKDSATDPKTARVRVMARFRPLNESESNMQQSYGNSVVFNNQDSGVVNVSEGVPLNIDKDSGYEQAKL